MNRVEKAIAEANAAPDGRAEVYNDEGKVVGRIWIPKDKRMLPEEILEETVSVQKETIELQRTIITTMSETQDMCNQVVSELKRHVGVKDEIIEELRKHLRIKDEILESMKARIRLQGDTLEAAEKINALLEQKINLLLGKSHDA